MGRGPAVRSSAMPRRKTYHLTIPARRVVLPGLSPPFPGNFPTTRCVRTRGRYRAAMRELYSARIHRLAVYGKMRELLPGSGAACRLSLPAQQGAARYFAAALAPSGEDAGGGAGSANVKQLLGTLYVTPQGACATPKTAMRISCALSKPN